MDNKTGKIAPTTIATSSRLLNPLCSCITIVPSGLVCFTCPDDTSGKTCTVATYKNVPALNNIAMPVVLISVKDSADFWKK